VKNVVGESDLRENGCFLGRTGVYLRETDKLMGDGGGVELTSEMPSFRSSTMLCRNGIEKMLCVLNPPSRTPRHRDGSVIGARKFARLAVIGILTGTSYAGPVLNE
jgi:hypothetical protein